MLRDPYLTKQLIAYIGNKRALLGHLSRVFRSLEARAPICVFLDPFAGSGAVSRLGKRLGYRVMANDWEPYARLLNAAHVATDRRDLNELFRAFGGIQAAIAYLNELSPTPGYITHNYAPARTESADYRTERLFYTRENALFLDSVRDEIERLYGAAPGTPQLMREKELLIALVLYQAATHANTSGVFKAFHKGFGGHGRDALTRIMAPMKLDEPMLTDGAYRCAASGMEAVRFCRMHPADCVYLDPPYNQHQYGSNYFMLNTIALWDKPPVSKERREDGSLKHKAGIRADWRNRRSAFCYRHSALDSFSELLEAIDSRFIVVSYNSDGIVSFEQLADILHRHGSVELHGSDYVSYRGGRQSPEKAANSCEFAVVVDRERRSSGADRAQLERRRLEQRLAALSKRSFDPAAIRRRFHHERDAVCLFPAAAAISMPKHYTFAEEPAAPARLELTRLREVVTRLQESVLSDALSEARVLVGILEDASTPTGTRDDDGSGRASRSRTSTVRRYAKRLVACARKCAHKKHEAAFASLMADARALLERRPELRAPLEVELNAVEARYEQRLYG